MKKYAILFMLLVFSCQAYATPMLKNCGAGSVDGYCTDAGCHIDFGAAGTSLASCELDFDTALPPGWQITDCHPSNAQLFDHTILPGQIGVVLTPRPPLTTLAGLNAYVICDEGTARGLQ